VRRALRRLGAALLLLAAVCTGCSSTVQGSGRHVPSCLPVFFGVAGSGQGIRNPAPGRVPAGVSAGDAHRFGTTVGLLKSDLDTLAGAAGGLATARAIDYPALPVDRYLTVLGLSPDLDISESHGVSALVDAIRVSQRGGCGTRPVLLSGYSQGAEVVIRAVGDLRPGERTHVAIALFGNPSHRPDAVEDYPPNGAGSGIRPTFLNGDTYTVPADVRSRTIDICAPGDPVCGVDPSLSNIFTRVNWVLDHVQIHGDAYAFGSRRYDRTAAKFLWRHRSG
jgi:predicted small secreted protein